MSGRFESSRLVEISPTGKKYLRNVIYPEIPLSADDIYVITTGGDRYDTLALQFYSNVDYWWIIAIANNETVDSLVVSPGTQLRIPAYPEDVQTLFQKINNII